MQYLLHIETATTACSVALSRGAELLALRETNNGYTHAENLHQFIGDLLRETGLTAHHLSGITVSRGPGSYTGLRIGVSAAKGLAFGLKLPVVAIDTLQAMSVGARQLKDEDLLYGPMIDARRMEVYTALYDRHLRVVSPPHARIIDPMTLEQLTGGRKVLFFGNGTPKCSELLRALPHAAVLEGISPSARHLCALGWQKFAAGEHENLAYFEPLYLKEFQSTQPKSGR